MPPMNRWAHWLPSHVRTGQTHKGQFGFSFPTSDIEQRIRGNGIEQTKVRFDRPLTVIVKGQSKLECTDTTGIALGGCPFHSSRVLDLLGCLLLLLIPQFCLRKSFLEVDLNRDVTCFPTARFDVSCPA